MMQFMHSLLEYILEDVDLLPQGIKNTQKSLVGKVYNQEERPFPPPPPDAANVPAVKFVELPPPELPPPELPPPEPEPLLPDPPLLDPPLAEPLVDWLPLSDCDD